MDKSHTDILHHLSIYRYLPSQAQGYVQLARFDQPVGFLLLYIPALWGATLGAAFLEQLQIFSLIATATVLLIGSVLARGMGCIWNDITDRKLDILVERTKNRPLPSGRISLLQAYLFLGFLALISIGILILLPVEALLLLPIIAIFVFIYPYTKRMTSWPQIVLGITFNASLFIGWCMTLPSSLLQIFTEPLLWIAYLAATLWTIGYDTIYAYQDIRDDPHANIRSSARYFQFQKAPVVLFILSSMMLLLILGVIEKKLSYLPLTLLPAFLYQAFILYRWQPLSPQKSLVAFQRQTIYGFLVVIGMLFAICVGIKS